MLRALDLGQGSPTDVAWCWTGSRTSPAPKVKASPVRNWFTETSAMINRVHGHLTPRKRLRKSGSFRIVLITRLAR